MSDQNEDQISHARGAYIMVHPEGMSPDLLAALGRMGVLVSTAFSISPEDAGEAETSQKSGQDEAFRKWRSLFGLQKDEADGRPDSEE